VIQSVNSRNLDVRFRFPPGLQALEVKFRKQLQNIIARGKVDVGFSYATLNPVDSVENNSTHSFNMPWVIAFCKSGEVLLDSLEWRSSDILQSALLRTAFSQRDAFSDAGTDVDVVADSLQQLLLDALDLHLESRRQEGVHLAEDIKSRLAFLISYINGIANKADSMPELFRQRINDRLALLIDNNKFELDPARVAQEVAHLIDKADISEEIVRFNAHIQQFYTEIDIAAERKGKKLEFIVQEMLREINTIGSKANLLEITKMVVEVKNELEKIREQVQNVV
jgi:uncharacterized protein (TIGR00255 family)